MLTHFVLLTFSSNNFIAEKGVDDIRLNNLIKYIYLEQWLALSSFLNMKNITKLIFFSLGYLSTFVVVIFKSCILLIYTEIQLK